MFFWENIVCNPYSLHVLFQWTCLQKWEKSCWENFSYFELLATPIKTFTKELYDNEWALFINIYFYDSFLWNPSFKRLRFIILDTLSDVLDTCLRFSLIKIESFSISITMPRLVASLSSIKKRYYFFQKCKKKICESNHNKIGARSILTKAATPCFHTCLSAAFFFFLDILALKIDRADFQDQLLSLILKT